MKTISRRSFAGTAALALTLALFANVAASAAEITVVTSGAVTAAYLKLAPRLGTLHA